MAAKVGEASVVITAVDQATAAINRITGNLTGLQSSFSKLSGALAIGGSVTWLANLGKQSLEALDNLDELAQGLGIAATKLSSFQLSAQAAGVGQDQLSSGLTKLNKSVSEAVGGNAEMAAIFREMGVAIRDAGGNVRGMDDILGDVADRMSVYAGGVNKSTLATELFGKANSKFVTFLSEGREGLEKFGGASEEQIQNATKMAANIDRLSASWEKLKFQVTGTVAGWFKGSDYGEETPEERIVRLNRQVDELTAKLANTDQPELIGNLQIALEGVNAELERTQRALADAGMARFMAGSRALRYSETGAGNAPNAAEIRERIAAQKKAAEEASRLADSQARVREEVLKEISALEMNSSATGKLSEAQRTMLKLGEAIAAGKVKLSQAETAEAFARLRSVDAATLYQATQEEIRKLDAESFATEVKQLQTIREAVQAQKEENAVIGATEAQQRGYKITLAEVTLEKIKAKLATLELSEAERQLFEAQAAAQEELIASMRTGAGRQASVDAAEASRDAWTNVARDIEQALTDAMVAGFEGGKSIAQSVGDWIVNYFRSVVARGIAQALIAAMGAGLSSIASAAGGGTAGGGGSAFGSILGGLGSAFSSGGGASTGIMGGIIGGFGTALGEGALATLSSWAGGSAISSGFAASGALSTMGGAGGAAASAGMAIGAAIPYLAIAYGLYRVISGVGTGRARGPAYQEWATSGPLSNMFAGAINNPGGGTWGGGHYAAQIDAIVSAVRMTATALGGAANARTSYGMFTSTSPDGRGAQVVGNVIGAGGGTLYSFNQNAGNADRNTLLGQMVPGLIMAGLQDADLPKQIKAYFNTVSASLVDRETLDRMIATAAAAEDMANAFDMLGGPFAELTNLSVDARIALADLTGGLDAFASKVSAYYREFYSDEERGALSLVEAQKILQAAGLDTGALTGREAYRNLVSSIDISTPQGQSQFAALMNAAGSFAAGSDLLTLSGMSLRDFTAGAPGLQDSVEVMVSTQDQTNALLGSIESAVVASGAAIVEAIRGQRLEVTVAGGGSSEVGLWRTNDN
jgi:hypothetical protein